MPRKLPNPQSSRGGSSRQRGRTGQTVRTGNAQLRRQKPMASRSRVSPANKANPQSKRRS